MFPIFFYKEPLTMLLSEVYFLLCFLELQYMNAGPGSLGGLFIHERYAYDKDLKRLLHLFLKLNA